MKYKVVFDTNSIRNAESFSDFLGGRSDLERFIKVSEIFIPDLVIEEIKYQKLRHLISRRDSFLTNPFHYLLNLKKEDTENFDIDNWILDCAKKEKIPYKTISITKNNEDVFEKIKQLCVKNLPPFDENSDRGFKDAYIYFTIIEFLDKYKDENLFVITKDDRLRQALQKHIRIKVVADFDEFEKFNVDYFRSDYFVGRLKEEVNEDIKVENIENIWLNLEDNWVLKIVCDTKTYFVEVDFSSKEIIGSTDFNFSDAITNIGSSGSFSSTHSYIELIEDYINYFSNEEIQNLIKVASENDQIYRIADDEGVKNLFSTLYKAKQQIIPEDIKEKFDQYFKII